jgi:3-methyladenine DNA glycosylase AlkD
MTYLQIIKELKSMANPINVAGMARFGINPKYALGVSIPNLRKTAKEIRRSYSAKAPQDLHAIAKKLWSSKIHEARILASMVDEPDQVTEKQMDSWIKKYNSWDLCDQVCMNLFDKTPYAFDKAIEWSKRSKEFEKRAGFALMACLAWHDKEAPDSKFIKFFPHIIRGATDERNFVKKAVNWALRQIGKRNKLLNKEAIKISKEIAKIDSKSARWIAKDALRELKSESVQKRLAVRPAH